MKIVIAQFKHETNTFSPVPTPLDRFGGGRPPPEGEAVLAAYRGTGSAIAAFIDLASQLGAQIDTPIAASAAPSAPCDDTVFDYVCDRICAAVARGCDAVLLDLHGAMVTASHDDGEGELLRRIRAVAPGVMIGVALDMHTNLSAEMVDNASVLSGYQTYPHVDMYETGVRAARPILASLQGCPLPVVAWGGKPMLTHVMRQGTDDEPNRSLQARCRELEAEGVLSATVFTGFPHADIAIAQLSAVVVDHDADRARRACDELLAMAWERREGFVYRLEDLDVSLARARALADTAPGTGPIVLLDHYDNCASGGTMDTTTVLGRLIAAGLPDAAAFAIYDPQAVQQMASAGVGAQVTVSLGGKLPMPSVGLAGEPLTVTGVVRRLSDGQFRNHGPMAKGQLVNMGPTAVLRVGTVDVIVISEHVEPHDIGCLEAVGIDPATLRFLMLKSRVHWRAGLRRYARAIVECAGTGVCTSDYANLRYRKLARPIYPLDPIAA
ncbi:MAG: M81 family metallopeptidase [Burkholderiales bacterium]|jgi:microcystin degradation protein MlrC